MTWVFQVLLCVALLVPNHRGDMPEYALALNSPLRFTDVAGGLPDSARMRMLDIRISSTGGDMLSWRGRELVSDNNFHVAVLNGTRIFDAFTGATGMTWAEYQEAMAYLGKLQYTVLP